MPLLRRSGLSVAPRFRWECPYGQIIERYDERGHLTPKVGCIAIWEVRFDPSAD